jgi:diguanylate cyclase (GGDEF)-like protein
MHSRFKSPIAIRLTIAFVAMLALLIGLSGMTLFRMQQVSNSLDRLSSDQLENLTLVSEIGENAEDAARKLLVLISASRPERMLAYAEVDAANRRLDSSMKILDSRLPGGDRRALFLAVADKLQAYRIQYGLNVDLIEAEDWVAARRMLVEKTEISLAELASAREALARSEHLATTAEADRLKARLDTDRHIVIGLCLFGVAVGASLAVLVTRGIVIPLRRAEAVAIRLTAGDYTSRVKVISDDDEVGRVSTALNSLAVAAGEREAALTRLANTDALTGVAQRARFVSKGNEILRELQGTNRVAALLCMDIDRLKLINSVLGFDAGDAAIVDAAGRISSIMVPGGLLGRLAGGTFAALVVVERALSAKDWAAYVQREVERKVTWDGQSLDLSLTIGIADWPDHAHDCEVLLRRAEQAMFEAKRQRVPIATFVASHEAIRSSHLTLLSELTEAIERGQLRMFVQPKVSPLDMRTHGVEALVRWEHPERGWISPAEFVPFAESTGRVRHITQWMLERAIETLKVWQESGANLTIAVNVSTVDLQDKSLPFRVEELLRNAGVAPHLLQLELTETGLLASGPDPIAVLHSLRNVGVRLAIDDFGTGQSSLGYLQRLPVHELKIDRSFVDGFNSEMRRQELLSSIIGLGHSLGLVVTAEGVETNAELSALANMGCDLVQGFLIAKPVDVAQFDHRQALVTGQRRVSNLRVFPTQEQILK